MGERNVTPSIIDNLGREQYPVFISESGLYSLVMSSKYNEKRYPVKYIDSNIYKF